MILSRPVSTAILSFEVARMRRIKLLGAAA